MGTNFVGNVKEKKELFTHKNGNKICGHCLSDVNNESLRELKWRQ